MRAFVWLFALAYAAGVYAQAPSTPALPDTVTVEANISYDQYPETVLDVIQPKAPSMGKRPGVIVIHGGGWVGGTKESQAIPFCMRYVERGFVCANVEYRLAKAATAPAAVTDVLKAAEWFRKNAGKYKVDKNRIVVTGGSAGGHLSLMVGMTPKSAKLGPTTKVKAVVNFYGITDVGDQFDGPHFQKYAVTWVPEQDGRMELARRVSPMSYVRESVPAVLTLHGDADPTVPYVHGVKLTRALRDAGGDAELISVPGGKHGFPKEVVDKLYDDHIWPFLRRHGVIK